MEIFWEIKNATKEKQKIVDIEITFIFIIEEDECCKVISIIWILRNPKDEL